MKYGLYIFKFFLSCTVGTKIFACGMSHCLYFLKLFSDANLCNVITYHKDFMKCVLFFQKTNADLENKYLLEILPFKRLSDLKESENIALINVLPHVKMLKFNKRI